MQHSLAALRLFQMVEWKACGVGTNRKLAGCWNCQLFTHVHYLWLIIREYQRVTSKSATSLFYKSITHIIRKAKHYVSVAPAIFSTHTRNHWYLKQRANDDVMVKGTLWTGACETLFSPGAHLSGDTEGADDTYSSLACSQCLWGRSTKKL